MMADFFGLLLCVVSLVGSFLLVVFSKCHHITWSYDGMRCPYCFASLRSILIEQRQKGQTPRKPWLYVDDRESPFTELWQWTMYRVETTPPDSSHTHIEVEYIDPDAPERIKQLYETMMWRRHGIAYLWMKRAAN